jgi:hypothetical protein
MKKVYVKVEYDPHHRLLMRSHLDDFVTCFHPETRFERTSTWSPETPDALASAGARRRSFT